MQIDYLNTNSHLASVDIYFSKDKHDTPSLMQGQIYHSYDSPSDRPCTYAIVASHKVNYTQAFLILTPNTWLLYYQVKS